MSTSRDDAGAGVHRSRGPVLDVAGHAEESVGAATVAAMSFDLAESGWFVLAGLIVMAVFAVIAVRSGYVHLTRKQTDRATAQRLKRAEQQEAERPPTLAELEPNAIWGIRSPGGQVERAGFRTAVAWASQDLTNETVLVKSVDGGKVWAVVPREEWRRGLLRP